MFNGFIVILQSIGERFSETFLNIFKESIKGFKSIRISDLRSVVGNIIPPSKYNNKVPPMNVEFLLIKNILYSKALNHLHIIFSFIGPLSLHQSIYLNHSFL